MMLICMSEVIDISPCSLDSSLCFIQPSILHDVLCIYARVPTFGYEWGREAWVNLASAECLGSGISHSGPSVWGPPCFSALPWDHLKGLLGQTVVVMGGGVVLTHAFLASLRVMLLL